MEQPQQQQQSSESVPAETGKPILYPKKPPQQQQQKKQAKIDGAGKGGGKDGADAAPRERAAGKGAADAAPGRAGGGGGGGGASSASRAPKGASRLAVFDHLPRKKQLDMDSVESDRLLHPAMVRLGVLFRSGAVYDDDDRVCALYAAFCNVVEDYKTPPNKNLSWDLDKHIRLQVQHLVDCRQLSMSMGNFIKFFRFTISQVDNDATEADTKRTLLDKLDGFIEERVSVAQQNIAKICAASIKDDDVILTFGSSPVVRQILLSSAKEKSFHLVVVDARPLKEALKTVSALSPFVPCTYAPLSCAATCMQQATKVILGASALLSNGSVLAPAGTAMVASLAKFYNVPVIIAAESYKFCEKVQLDSIVFNELGSCSELVAPAVPSPDAAGGGADGDRETGPSPVTWGGYQSAAEASEVNRFPFQVINLRYDITPIDAVSVVATEAGMIPPTSVPVLIRELRLDQTGTNIVYSVSGSVTRYSTEIY
jgi:translation initiation factor eIF-2B subunit delta